MVDSVKTAIWNALNHYAFEDAVFAAERLYAEVANEETAFLLATSLYRAGQKHRALEVLSSYRTDTQASSEIRYLIGRICYDLEQYPKAEVALANNLQFEVPYGPEDVENLYKQNTCSYALQLLGNIQHKSHRKEMAAASLKRAVSLNPFQWSSFETVCRMKEDITAKDVFFRSVSKVSQFEPAEEYGAASGATALGLSILDLTSSRRDEDEEMPLNMSLTVVQPLPSAFVKATSRVVVRSDKCNVSGSGSGRTSMGRIAEEAMSPHTYSPQILLPPCISTPRTPQSSHSQLNLSQDSLMNRNSLVNPPKKKPPFPFRLSSANSSTAHESSVLRSRRQTSETTSISSSGRTSSPQQLQPTLRRSARLQTSAVKENKTVLNNKKRSDFDGASDIKPVRKDRLGGNSHNIKSENLCDKLETYPAKKSVIEETGRKSTDLARKRKVEPSLILLPPSISSESRTQPPTLSESTLTEQERFTSLVMHSYCRFGEVVQLLHRFDIPAAKEKLDCITPEQRDAPFYWYLKGRLHFEMLEYPEAVVAFEEMRRKDPCYIQGVEYYSVALWHLQREKDLAVLAKYLIENHRDLPETYIVYGNVFSVQREHEYAIKMFRRALQLNPHHPYALTMIGHEYTAMDERDKAAQCFRLAIHADPAHYNGWYGLGMIEYKKENYPGAMANFKKALEIYPTNPIILVQLGVAQHALKLTAEALRTLTSAVVSFPRNPLCRFQRASLLYSLGHLEEALKELEVLKDLAPKESLVYFLMGKVSKRTDKTHQALMYFSKAMDLDPKGTNNQIKEAFNKLYGGMEDDVVPQRAASGTTCSRDSQASSIL